MASSPIVTSQKIRRLIGMPFYSEYQVRSPLSAFIKKLWTLDNSGSRLETGERAVLPNGCFTIAFISGNGILVKTRLTDTLLSPGVYFVGQLTGGITVNLLPHTKAIMVQLFAWAPVHFSKAPMSAYTDRVVPLTDPVISVDILNNPAIALAVHRAFVDHFRHNKNTFLIQQACLLLAGAGGALTVGNLAAQLGCSERQLQKQFKQHIGLSPKAFAIILRLRNAVDDIAYPRQAHILLSNLALENNFYDQAHFINTFQSIVGMSPAKFDKTAYLLAFKK